MTFSYGKGTSEASEVKGRVDISFDNGQKTYVDLLFKLGENRPYCCINAADCAENHKVDGNGFETIDFLGREGSAIKAFPPMKSYELFADEKEDSSTDWNSSSSKVPYVAYEVSVAEVGAYDILFFLMTRNPSVKGGRMKFYASANDDKPQVVYSVSDHYYTEWQDADWAQGVLTAGRQVSASVNLRAGKNTIKVYAGDTGVIIDKLVIKRSGYELPTTYLGPIE